MSKVNLGEYIKTIDEIRKTRKLSVSELCENIIDERTYYRYLKAEKSINYKIIEQLAQKLNIEIYELIYYAFFIKHSDPGISRFIYRIHIGFFQDIVPIYKSVKKYQTDNERINLLLKNYINKYDCMNDKLPIETYHTTLRESINHLSSFNYPCINTILLTSLYLKEFPEETPKYIRTIADYFEERFVESELLFSIIALDNALKAYLASETSDMDAYKKLTAMLEKIVIHFPHRYFQNRHFLYQAYLKHCENNKKAMQDILYKYLLGITIFSDPKHYTEEKALVKRLFNIDTDTYLREKTSALLNNPKAL